jgi:uncharacterized protein YbbC (DUF1343 family)
MIAVRVTDRDRVRPDAVGLWMLREIRRRHPREFQWREAHMDRLAGSDRARKAVDASDEAVHALLATYERESRTFAESARRYHLYR